jgi:hypothetical protein
MEPLAQWWSCSGCGHRPDGPPPPRCPVCQRSRLYYLKSAARMLALGLSRWSLLEID